MPAASFSYAFREDLGFLTLAIGSHSKFEFSQ